MLDNTVNILYTVYNTVASALSRHITLLYLGIDLNANSRGPPPTYKLVIMASLKGDFKEICGLLDEQERTETDTCTRKTS
jgi:hypothetical protein